ncbi:hypothetical protein ACJIZ3_022139 [Penstemon smallii]|uniref:RING-type domain-containing protein n=1 Tax=Penstemon smallii TaxID=265156 RepID=A0ABD3SNR2_9LAMI
MEQGEQRSNGGEFPGGAPGPASGENYEESPPLPFPHRIPEYSRYPFSHGERFGAANVNEGYSASRNDDAWSCVISLITFSIFVTMTLILGFYSSETLHLGPNTSMLIEPNHFLVDSIKVVELDAVKRSILYGFYTKPPLDDVITWSETHKITLPFSTHKEWIYYLNEGSHINISYSLNSHSPSSLVLVIAKGQAEIANWLENPSQSDTTLSWNFIYGNGTTQKYVQGSSTYYIAVGNLNAEAVKVELTIRIKAFLFNTTGAYYKCTLAQDQCSFKLFTRGVNAAVLTSPGGKSGSSGGDCYVKISYGPKWITYLVGIGGITVIVLAINYFLNRFRSTGQDTIRDQTGDMGSERNPLLSHKDDDLSSCGSSYASVSEDDTNVEDAQAGDEKHSEHRNSTHHLCAICFDSPKDSFFLPCGHCVACFGCATRIVENSATCPICRRHTKKVRKIYTV